jgi:hypothetical protein
VRVKTRPMCIISSKKGNRGKFQPPRAWYELECKNFEFSSVILIYGKVRVKL